MHASEELCNEELHILHKDGRQSGPLKAVFEKDKFRVFECTFDVSEGDCIYRTLSNGKAERYDIIKVNYTRKLYDIPAYVDMAVRKQGALVPCEKNKTVNISIHNSHGFQVGDYNSQQIVDSFKQVIERLDHAPGTPEEKAEAKTRLKALLEHPLISAIVGGAVGGLLDMIK